MPGSTTPQRFEDHHIYLPAPVNEKDLERIAKVGANTLPAWISEVGYGGFPDLPRNVARYRREGNPLAPDYRFHERLLASLERVMDEHRLRELFPDASALCLASQQVQADGNKLQIEAIRINSQLGGYCLHAFTDGDWVLGAGVLDMWREPKRIYQSVQEANQPLALVVRAAPQNIYAEKGARVAVTAINESAATEAELLVTLEGGSWGFRREVKLSTGITSLLDEQLPTENLRGPRTIHARLVQGERLLAESRHDIFIVGREQLAPGFATVTVFDPQTKVAPFLERLGVTVRPLETGSAPGRAGHRGLRRSARGAWRKETRGPAAACPGRRNRHLVGHSSRRPIPGHHKRVSLRAESPAGERHVDSRQPLHPAAHGL